MTNNIQLHERLSFMKVSQQTQENLAILRPLVARHIPTILDDFYAHLQKFPQIADMFADDSVRKHAAARQTDHWLALLEGKFDEHYARSARTIGMTHARIGLEPRWYIAGYNHIVSHVLPLIAVDFLKKNGQKKGVHQKLGELQATFMTAVMLDMDIAISVYLDQTDATKRKNTLQSIAEQLETSLGSIVNAVAAASTELDNTARSMSRTAEQTSRNTTSVSAAMEQATTNVSSVATSTGEMGAVIGEISKQISQASTIANKAVKTADGTNEIMERLSQSTAKIGEVVSLISDIAAQTNLLALNATIESARAGEAGKGFAVVASEVKSLATQTGKATEDIAKQIQEVQSIAKQSVDAIGSIRTTIADINHSTIAINAAVEEQSTSTKEIARNTAEAAEGARNATSHIGGVQQAVFESETAASQVVEASSELGKQAETLRAELGRFIALIRAA